MTTLKIQIPEKLVWVFEGEARYRGAYGGRGSAKTRTFAKMAAVMGRVCAEAGETGIVLCGREYMNSLDESSMAEVKAAIASEPWLAEYYDVGERYIRTVCGRVEFKFAGLRHNLDSIKSKSRILILWVDEAEPVSEKAWVKIIPTVREQGSEIWVTWNPERKASATNKRFRIDCKGDPAFRIVQMNYRDNPWFPDVLEQERLRDMEKRPEQYEHIWEGDYATVIEGAYYAESLSAARKDGRIGRVRADPLLPVYSVDDIGGAGAKADAYSKWIVQFVGKEIRILDHYTSQGQTLDFHVNWMRDNGWERGKIVLPHDGVNTNNVTGKRYEDHWRDAGFDVDVIPNQGRGAAMQRVQAARRVFPNIWFNEDTTEAGRESLGHYHEKRSEDRDIGLGPEHDWSSHDADAFGLMAVFYEERLGVNKDSAGWKAKRKSRSPKAWMGA
jgi:phage terminase large subunit